MENIKKLISGKIREVYEIDADRLVIVTTDRISAYDVILSKSVKNKGILLNAISAFWFDYTKDIVKNHMISQNLQDMPVFFQKPEFEGRTIMVKKLDMLPFEFIVRGYIFGNMWNAYKDNKEFCGLTIEGEYQQAQKLEMPILTPSTKASEGHDIYVPFCDVADNLGIDTAEKLKKICLNLYAVCYDHAYKNGIIMADTKFEFGIDKEGSLVLADEIFTPDSSRFWSLEDYKIGMSPKSYDKQFLRDWLTDNKLNGSMQFDNVPDEIIDKTLRSTKYVRTKL